MATNNWLTMDTLRVAIEALHDDMPLIFGIACNYRSAKIIYESDGHDKYGLVGPKILIDPRMVDNSTEVYFDEVAWLKRCEEQQKYDKIRQERR